MTTPDKTGKIARNITLIGMPGAGKSTVGAELARYIHWAHMDVDQLIESIYGVPLQRVVDSLSKEEFLDMEGAVVQGIWSDATVLSPGGSVVYREEAMRYLQSLGPVVYLKVPLPVILERIARNPDRGIAIGPGQTIEDLFIERERLYTRYAEYTLEAEGLTPAACAAAIMADLRGESSPWTVLYGDDNE